VDSTCCQDEHTVAFEKSIFEVSKEETDKHTSPHTTTLSQGAVHRRAKLDHIRKGTPLEPLCSTKRPRADFSGSTMR